MARLNEPGVAPAAGGNAIATTTAAGESLDVLKRRFIRQNRELAKNNSTQSLRIRNLELEVSKLLSDNLDLREQVLSLQNEVQNARRQASGDAIRQMKEDLRMKIAELSGLVDGFEEDAPEEEVTVPDKERILSPSRQQYRERQPLADLLQDTAMPTIVEDKQFPRRTLDPEEIRAIRLSDQSGTTGSPDLGPPPEVHFDVEDPIKFNKERELEAREQAPTSPQLNEEELLPSINLETRRRRRDSKLEIRRHSIMAQSPVKDVENGTTMLRTGAKRKLSDRETEKPIKPPSQGDFTFSRKASADQSASDEEKLKAVEEHVPTAEPDESTVAPALASTKPARRVLGEKSVNMSPRKATARTGKPLKEDPLKPAPPKAVATKERPPSRGRRVSAIPTPAPQEEAVPTFEVPPPEPSTEEQLHLAKTPAPPSTDLFSPLTSEPSASARPAEARDTPPPSELSHISNTTEGGQRPSRRARSAVSYAEPSLIAKMRRPDDKKVDAISGLKKPPNASADSRKSGGGSTRTSLTGSITIKREPVDDESAWKGVEEGSPLREKSTDQHPPAAETVASNAGLSSVIASSRKRREQFDRREPEAVTEKEPSPDAIAKKMEELDLYDFKDSSSPLTVEAKEKPASKSAHRRHSSVPKEKSVSTSVAASTTTAPKPERNSRRRSMMV